MFSLSVVSLPMLLHRKVGFATALVTRFHGYQARFCGNATSGRADCRPGFTGIVTDFIAMAVFSPGWGTRAGMPVMIWSSGNNNFLPGLVANNQALSLHKSDFQIVLQAR
jgi:hypothetical protein